MLVWFAGLAVCAAGGWAAVAFWPNPNERLVQHLPILERYEAYRAVGDLGFLRSLNDTHVLELDELPSADADLKAVESNACPNSDCDHGEWSISGSTD